MMMIIVILCGIGCWIYYWSKYIHVYSITPLQYTKTIFFFLPLSFKFCLSFPTIGKNIRFTERNGKQVTRENAKLFKGRSGKLFTGETTILLIERD